MTELMTPQEVADQLRISSRQVHRLIESNDLNSVRIGRNTVRIPADSVKALIERGKTDAIS